MADEVDASKWQEHPGYAPTVKKLKTVMPAEYQAHVDATPCFAWLWQDQTGAVCDQLQCGLRSYCRNAWQMVQVAKSEAVKKDLTATEAYRCDLASVPQRKKLKRRQSPRGKYKDTGKYKRAGYVNKERLADKLAAKLRDKVSDFVWLPEGAWSSSYDCTHDCALKTTASYHALIVRGTIVARLWTNAPRRGTLDVVPELVTVIGEWVRTMDEDAAIKGPTKIPNSCRAKCRPCTHRFIIFSEVVMGRVVDIIREKFGV
jgi:hypothetical protein